MILCSCVCESRMKSAVVVASRDSAADCTDLSRALVMGRERLRQPQYLVDSRPRSHSTRMGDPEHQAVTKNENRIKRIPGLFYRTVQSVLDMSANEEEHKINVDAVNMFPNGRWRLIFLCRLTILGTVIVLVFPLALAIVVVFLTLSIPFALVGLALRPLWNRYVPEQTQSNGRRLLKQPDWQRLMFHLRLPRSRYPEWLIAMVWVYTLLFSAAPEEWEGIYVEAWRKRLAQQGAVVNVNIFVGSKAMSVPLLYDPENSGIGTDRQTFEMLRMWYSWMQFRRGSGEVILPRKLKRIDRVKVRTLFTQASYADNILMCSYATPSRICPH